MRTTTGLLIATAILTLPMAAGAQMPATQNGRYGPLVVFANEVKAGTLSPADYAQLVAIRDNAMDQMKASNKRDAGRSTYNSASLQTMMQTVEGEMAAAVGSGNPDAVLDAVLSGNHAATTQSLLPQLAQAGLVLDDTADMLRKLYTARAKMAGANSADIQRALHTIDLGQSAINAALYSVRRRVDAADTAAQSLPPAQRAALITRTDNALKNGDIKLGPSGQIEISPALQKAAGLPPSSGTIGSGGSLGNANGSSANPVKPGGAPPGYDNSNGGDGQPPGYDTGKLPPREEIYRNVYDKNGNVIRTDDSRPILYDKNGDPYPNPDYNPELDAQVQRAQQAAAKAAQSGQGGGGASGGSGGGVGGSGGSTLYNPSGADYATLSANGYSSVALDTIYGQAQVVYGDGWSNTMPIPSTQVAGPSSVLSSPDTHPQGPSSGGLTGPSSAGLTGISSAGATGPSSVMTGPSSAMSGPSSVMTGSSSAGLTGPSSTMTTTETQLNTPSDALGNPDARAQNDDDQPSLCGR